MTDEALKLLREVIAAFEPNRHLSIRETALRLDCSSQYVREHLILFPNAWRMAGGDIRIPVKDIEAMISKSKIHKFQTTTS